MSKALRIVLFMAVAAVVFCNNKPTGTETRSAPAITTQPASQMVRTGDAVTLTVVATGAPDPDYQWRKNGVLMPGQTAASLAISAAAFDDSGTYEVVVSNTEGSATSDPATLVVYSISITAQPASDTVPVDSAFSLTVTAAGIPDPAYEWRLNGFPILNETHATYAKSVAAMIDAGVYQAVVSCPVGTVFSDTVRFTVIP
jgi:hypothetical protein